MDKNWKAFERRVAKKCGGTRISVSDRKTDLDVDHPHMGIECKYRNKLPQYLKDWYSQAERGSTEDQKELKEEVNKEDFNYGGTG